MPQTQSRCRLFVLAAHDAPIAVVLRRGPSNWYHLIRWRTDIDTFEPGAWFRGRIYEERCDLSPDGELLVYFCHGGAYRAGYTASWTAVSRAPWLHALALWPWGTTYGGGGRFVDDRKLILHSRVLSQTHPDHPVCGLNVMPGIVDYHRYDFDDADWFGYVRPNSFVICRDGKLFRRGTSGGNDEIADFSRMRPNPRPAPEWARQPLPADLTSSQEIGAQDRNGGSEEGRDAEREGERSE